MSCQAGRIVFREIASKKMLCCRPARLEQRAPAIGHRLYSIIMYWTLCMEAYAATTCRRGGD